MKLDIELTQDEADILEAMLNQAVAYYAGANLADASMAMHIRKRILDVIDPLVERLAWLRWNGSVTEVTVRRWRVTRGRAYPEGSYEVVAMAVPVANEEDLQKIRHHPFREGVDLFDSEGDALAAEASHLEARLAALHNRMNASSPANQSS